MKYQLLYVDDEESNLRVFKSSFRRNYIVHTASSAIDGLKILESHNVDVVLSDQRMPEISGVDFLQNVAVNYPRPVRMLISGFVDFEALKDAINGARIFHYIQKPWDELELTRLIDNTLKIKYLEKENYKQKNELISTVLQISKTASIINHVIKLISNLRGKNDATKCYNELQEIQKSLKFEMKKQDNWELFKMRFREVHPEFFNRIQREHPEISKTELRYCAYLRINMSTSQIAAALNVTTEAIKKTRYRIRKKTGLKSNLSLDDYIANF